MIRFGAPEMLWVSVPLALVVIARVRRLPLAHVGIVRRLVQAAMVLASVAAALALGRPEIGRPVDRMSVVFLLDESRSVQRSGETGSAEALAQIRRAIDGMEAGDSAALVVFGGEPATLVAPTPRPAIGVVRASIPRDATDIAAAVRRGLAELRAEGAPRIVLLSDGNET